MAVQKALLAALAPVGVGCAPPQRPSGDVSLRSGLLASRIETGTHPPWVSRLLEEGGHEVLVANARKLRLIYASMRKFDEINAENLARLARLDSKLLYPLKH